MSVESMTPHSRQQIRLRDSLRRPLDKVMNAWGTVAMLENWWTAFSNRVSKMPGAETVDYNLRNGMRFSLSAGSMDVVTLLHVIHSRMYEPTNEFRIQNDWTVLDLGAHKGMFAVHAARSGRDTRVLSLEPEPRNYSFLKRNLERNNVANVEAMNAAVWVSSGEIKLQVGDSLDHSIVSLNRGAYASAVRTQSLTLDDLVQRAGGHVDFVKMDIEGAEHAVIQSSSAETLRSIDRIALEYHSVPPLTASRVATDIESTLEQNGFCCFRCREMPDQLFAIARRQV